MVMAVLAARAAEKQVLGPRNPDVLKYRTEIFAGVRVLICRKQTIYENEAGFGGYRWLVPVMPSGTYLCCCDPGGLG